MVVLELPFINHPELEGEARGQRRYINSESRTNMVYLYILTVVGRLYPRKNLRNALSGSFLVGVSASFPNNGDGRHPEPAISVGHSSRHGSGRKEQHLVMYQS